MARLGHGGIGVRRKGAGVSPLSSGNQNFGYMFSADPAVRPADADRLPDGTATIAALTALGDAMGEGAGVEPPAGTDLALPGDGTIPAGYTYFGQFVDHDITMVAGDPGAVGKIDQPSFPPMASLAGVINQRTPFLELDSVYGQPGATDNLVPPAVGNAMVTGPVTKVTNGPPPFAVIAGKSRFNDLPRKPRNNDPAMAAEDREAKIGDPRNDENLLVAQLHVAFLKAHNALAGLTGSFDTSRTTLTKMYQSVVLDDYLHRICDSAILGDIEANGPQTFKPSGPLFMPIEFAAAGFRFGHSMVRSQYNFNLNFPNTSSSLFFVFTALSGQLGGTDTFPDNWIIQWERFLPINGSTPQSARPIDPMLTPILFALHDVFGNVEGSNIAKHLAKRNLLRGFLFGLPMGQAMAAKLGVAAIEISTATTGWPDGVLTPFKTRTPLWLYVLAEAKLNGGKLGAVGSRIVGETLHTLVRRSTPSIFNSDGTRNITAKYKLSDIINLAGIQDTEVAGA